MEFTKDFFNQILLIPGGPFRGPIYGGTICNMSHLGSNYSVPALEMPSHVFASCSGILAHWALLLLRGVISQALRIIIRIIACTSPAALGVSSELIRRIRRSNFRSAITHISARLNKFAPVSAPFRALTDHLTCKFSMYSSIDLLVGPTRCCISCISIFQKYSLDIYG